MKKITKLSISTFTFLLAGYVNASELSSTVSFTNDYRYHGVSQTAGDAALQGSIDLSFDSGFYAGIWGSNVDLGSDIDANLEIDYYVGYANSINEDLTYDATLLYFQYPGSAVDLDYAEIDFGFHFKDFSLFYSFTDNYANSSESAQYTSLDYAHAITKKINLNLHLGTSFGDYWDSSLDIGSYEDYSVGISGNLVGLNLSANYLYNNIKSANEIDNGLFRNDETLVLTVSHTF